MRIIGIDPGKSGGIAWLERDMTYAARMPETTADVWEQIRFAAQGCVRCFAWLEKVGPMPKQGVRSVWTFGRGYGELLMALTAAEIPHELVAPGVWQRKLGCLTRGDKNVTKAMAQRLFPNLTITHAIADALLIAEYGRRAEQSRA